APDRNASPDTDPSAPRPTLARSPRWCRCDGWRRHRAPAPEPAVASRTDPARTRYPCTAAPPAAPSPGSARLCHTIYSSCRSRLVRMGRIIRARPRRLHAEASGGVPAIRFLLTLARLENRTGINHEHETGTGPPRTERLEQGKPFHRL